MWRVGVWVVQRWVVGLRWEPAGLLGRECSCQELECLRGFGGGLFVLVGNLME